MRRMDIVGVWLAVTAACLCVFGSIVHPGFTFAGMDFQNLIYPRGVLIQKSLLAGHVPLWNPYEWSGSPLLAAMQGGVLYPLNWLFDLLPLPYGQQLATLLHLVLAGAGAGLLCGYLTGAATGAMVFAGVAYACGGFVLGRFEQVNVISTFAWTPWLFLTAIRLLKGHGTLLTFSAVCTMALLAGHPQTFALAVLAFVIFLTAGFVPGCLRRQPDPSLLRLPWLAVGGIFACLATAAQLFPTQELSQLSERVWPYPDPFAPAVEMRHLLPSLIIPRYYNSLLDTSARPFGFSEVQIYAGMLTPLLAIAGMFIGLRQRQMWAYGLTGMSVFAFWFALGKQGGLASWTMELIPFLQKSRGTARMLNCAMLGLAVTAGFGLHQLVLLASKSTPATGRWLVWGTAALLIADLALVHRPELNSLVVRSEALQVTSPLKAHTLTDNSRLYRFMAHDSNYYLDNRPSAIHHRQMRLQPNQGSITGISLLDGYEEGLLPTRAYANMLRRFNRNLRSDAIDPALLAMLGCNHLLTDYLLEQIAGWTMLAKYSPRFNEPLSLHKSQLQPLGIVTETDLAVALPQPSLEMLNSFYADPPAQMGRKGPTYAKIPAGRTAVEHPFQQATTPLPSRLPASTASFNPNRVEYPAINTTGTLLIFGLNYPGWKLETAEGQFTSVKPANALYSVAQFESSPPRPEPPTSISLVYRPFSFRLGLFSSLCSIAGCLTFLFRRIMP